MKVLHISYCFYPDPVGGTEVYVASLAHALQEQQVESVIAAPGERNTCYAHQGLIVHRFAVAATISDLSELYGEGDVQAADAFAEILETEQPDLVHLHAFTRGASLRVVRAARQRGIPVVFTYHTPTVSCQRGTLLRWGKDVCDGVLKPERCAACALHGAGMPRPLAQAIARAPSRLSRTIQRGNRSGGLGTALRMRELVRMRQAAFRELMCQVNHVIVLSQWTRDLLVRNGVPHSKITLIRHGLTSSAQTAGVSPTDKANDGVLRIAALGRLDPTKGFDTLVRAIRSLPKARLELDIYGVAQGEASERYLRQLARTAKGDARIRFLTPVARESVVTQLEAYHLVAVPSSVVETGPLVVLEAFTAGIPVLGSNLGGIAELVEDEVNGLLVEPSSPQAFAQALSRILEDDEMLARLRRGIRPLRHMEAAADEMVQIYRHHNEKEVVR